MNFNVDELKSFPPSTLLDIARNPSARHEAQLAAVEELMDRDDRRALHPDLAVLVIEIEQARLGREEAHKEAEAVMEPDVAPSDEDATPELKASVTTASLMQDERIEPDI